jgi:hypothetical protein
MNKSKMTQLTVALSGISLAAATAAHAALIESLPLNGTTTAVVGLDGTAVNGPTATTGYDGTAGGATAFQPVSYFGNYVSIPDAGGLSGATQGTLAMWVRWNGLQNQTAVESLYGSVTGRQVDGSSSDDVIALNGADPNSADISFWFNNQTGVGLTGATPVGDGVWHFVAVTFTPTTENLYLDGALDGSVTGSFGQNSVSDAPLTVGAWTGAAAGYSNSDIAGFQVFDTALTQQQVVAAQSASAVPEPASAAALTAAASVSLGRRRRAIKA